MVILTIALIWNQTVSPKPPKHMWLIYGGWKNGNEAKLISNDIIQKFEEFQYFNFFFFFCKSSQFQNASSSCLLLFLPHFNWWKEAAIFEKKLTLFKLKKCPFYFQRNSIKFQCFTCVSMLLYCEEINR